MPLDLYECRNCGDAVSECDSDSHKHRFNFVNAHDNSHADGDGLGMAVTLPGGNAHGIYIIPYQPVSALFSDELARPMGAALIYSPPSSTGLPRRARRARDRGRREQRARPSR